MVVNDKRKIISLENNLNKLLKFFTEDLIVTVNDGFYVQGQEDYRNRFRPSKNTEITSDRKDHYFIGDKFIERVVTTSKSENNGKSTTTESDAVHIWVKEKGHWKINMEIRIGEKEI
ncbi:MAG: nuclear transport factor 2 family protein [Candidatus Heimdallarchaeota archaeon]